MAKNELPQVAFPQKTVVHQKKPQFLNWVLTAFRQAVNNIVGTLNKLLIKRLMSIIRKELEVEGVLYRQGRNRD